jgi:hypothetical protein
MRGHHHLISEVKEERQLTLERSPLLMGTPIAPSMDSPRATSKDWLQLLAIGSLSKEVPQRPMGEELNLDAATTMMPEKTAWEQLSTSGMTKPELSHHL